MVLNSDITKLNVIVTFITSLILLLIIVIGLLRLHVGGGGMLDLGSFLRRQVGGGIFPWLQYFDALMCLLLGRVLLASHLALLLGSRQWSV